MAGKIFINYRRGDDPGFAQALFGRLEQVFSPEQLFMDVDNIEPGLDFVRVLEEQVAQCDVLISVIGRNWIDARDETGGRRLDNPEDFVRIEIESGLQQNKRIIPVLVGQAQMPSADQLPEPMKPLARRNAVRLTHERFRADTEALIAALQRALKDAEDARAAEAEQQRAEIRRRAGERAGALSGKTVKIAGGVALAILAIAGAIFWFNSRPIPPPAIVPGQLTISEPPALAFSGEQGGPFSPPSIAVEVKAAGNGFHWSTAGATPAWLSVAPTQGDLPRNGSAQIALTLAAAARSLAPGRYEGQIFFRNDSSKAIVASNVSVVVSAKPPPPPAARVAPTPAPTVAPTPAPAAPTQQAANAPLSAAQEAALKAGDTFQECTNCPVMMVVPAGSFTMGSPASDPDSRSNEGPQHKVTIAGQFAIAQFELTFDEWDACVADGGCNGYKPADEGWGRGSRPVINVSWNDATAYVAWLAKKTGKPYRLLSESEYEYATRAGTTTAYPWGDAIGSNNANCNGCGSQWGGKQTAPVGSFAANGFGLYDMVGNVWEWTQDCYHDSYNGAPSDGSAWTNGDCSLPVLRGGSWDYLPRLLRSARRYGSLPVDRYDDFGFRVGRTLLTP